MGLDLYFSMFYVSMMAIVAMRYVDVLVVKVKRLVDDKASKMAIAWFGVFEVSHVFIVMGFMLLIGNLLNVGYLNFEITKGVSNVLVGMFLGFGVINMIAKYKLTRGVFFDETKRFMKKCVRDVE